jgi:hypothetical protein
MVVAVVYISIVRTLKSSFESGKGLSTRHVHSLVLLAFRLIKDLSLALHTEVVAKS